MGTIMAHPIREYIDRNKLSITEVARSAEVSRTSLSRLVNGSRSGMEAAAFRRLAAATGLSLDEVMAEVASESKSTHRARTAHGGGRRVSGAPGRRVARDTSGRGGRR